MTLKLLLIFSKDTGVEMDLYLKSENIMVIADSNVNCLMKLFLILFFQNTKAICRDFIFDNADAKYYIVIKQKRYLTQRIPKLVEKIKKQLLL